MFSLPTLSYESFDTSAICMHVGILYLLISKNREHLLMQARSVSAEDQHHFVIDVVCVSAVYYWTSLRKLVSRQVLFLTLLLLSHCDFIFTHFAPWTLSTPVDIREVTLIRV